ncbi:butyrophilin subfamily 1 member A1-like [Discoglossus pictus]
MDRALVYFSLTFLAPAVSVTFQVQTQGTELVAEVGSDVRLPCTLSPPLGAFNLEVRWFRTLFYSPVFLLVNGREDKEQQSTEYRGRASLQAGPETGDLTLLLRKIHLSDNGTYNCFVENKTSQKYEEAVIQLNVVALGSLPHLEVSLQDSGVLLSFTSYGWFPQPTMHWEGKDGSFFNSDFKTTLNKSSGLFRVDSSILLQDPAPKEHLLCAAQNSVIGKRTGVYVKVSEALLPRVSPYAYAFYFTLALLFAGVFLVLYYVRRLLKDKERISTERDNLIAQVQWRSAVMNPALITFLPETAHTDLTVSYDRLTLSPVPPDPPPPPNEFRFVTELCCLGLPAFSEGCHYWEVEIGDGLEWAVGVAGPEVSRSGAYMFSPGEHIWCISRFVERFKALDTPEMNLEVDGDILEVVGVYLNIGTAEVSFYDPHNWLKLYTFTGVCPRGGRVYPFFWLGTNGRQMRLRRGQEVQITQQRVHDEEMENREIEGAMMLQQAV